MILFQYKNIFLFLLVSISYSVVPISDAGVDKEVVVTVCDDSYIVVPVDGSGSDISGIGVCDVGTCSNDEKYCATSFGFTDEACNATPDCGSDKVCVGGDSDGLSCSDDDSICGDDGSCELLKLCLSQYSYKSHCEGDWDGDGISDGVWEPEYSYDLDKSECDALEGVSNHKWYDYSLNYSWQSDSNSLEIENSSSVATNIIFNPLSSSESQSDIIYLIVNNTFSDTTFSDTSQLTISLDPKLPCAVAGDDIYLCRACADPNSAIYNPEYVDSVLSVIQLDASDSYLNGDGGDSFDYLWTAPEGFKLSSSNIVNPQLLIEDNDYAAMKKAVHIFTLEVIDKNSNQSSVLDTLTIFMNPSRPSAPKVEVYTENDKITLNWARNSSMFSIDSLSGYSDFEGYRVYRSLDGGNTWGDADDKIFYNGEHVGWRYKDQTDMSDFQDSNFCNKGVNRDIIGDEIGDGIIYRSWEECVGMESDLSVCCYDNSVRGSSISSFDPYAPWINLGDDRGLEFSYVDTSVYNGKEYTYAVVAYDIGLPGPAKDKEPILNDSEVAIGKCTKCDESTDDSLTEQECCESIGGTLTSGLCEDHADAENITAVCDDYLWEPKYKEIDSWLDTNPDSLTYDGFRGFQSLESYYIDSVNVVTAVPAFYAENVELISNFQDAKDFGVPAEDKFMNRNLLTVGNGGVYFEIINAYDITDKNYQFQIKADYAEDENILIFEGYKTESPSLYVWEVEAQIESGDTIYVPAKTPEEAKIIDLGLTHADKCEYMSLPGATIDGVCSRSTRVCDGGSNDGKECTYQDVCGDGDCIVSSVNYLDNYYACVCDDILANLSGANGSALENNDWITDPELDEIQDLNTIYIPVYEIEDFAIKYLYEDGYEENYTSFLDGLKFLFNNNVESVSDLIDGAVQVNSVKSFDSDSVQTDLANSIDIKLEYGSGGNVFYNKPSYSYRIEFSDVPKYQASDVTGGCDGQSNTLLPFKVVNITTGKTVGVNHVDKGVQYDEAQALVVNANCIEVGNPCSQSQYCNDTDCIDYIGYEDCFWEKNERTSFTKDLVRKGLTTQETEEYTFDLKIDYDSRTLYSKGIDPMRVSDWTLGQSYEPGNVVKYSDMYWEAQSQPGLSDSPVDWIDDGNGNNVNAWSPIYPWEDGDYIIIEPTRWYIDGDSWIADLSQLGRSRSITQKDLEEVSVVPNPYIVYSDYDETSSSRRLWFNHLPNKCRITIYTISGERVFSVLHDDDTLSGKESWDLRSQGGDLVAPGLYLYTVESEDGNGDYISHISKFAIIR